MDDEASPDPVFAATKPPPPFRKTDREHKKNVPVEIDTLHEVTIAHVEFSADSLPHVMVVGSPTVCHSSHILA